MTGVPKEFQGNFLILMSTKLTLAAVTSIELGLVTVRLSPARTQSWSMHTPDDFYNRFIEPIEDRMIRSVWRITRKTQDAEDAMQTALLVVWKRRDRVVAHAVPPALILKICVDTAHSIARRRARDRRRTEPPDHGNEPVDRAVTLAGIGPSGDVRRDSRSHPSPFAPSGGGRHVASFRGTAVRTDCRRDGLRRGNRPKTC